MSLNAKHFAEVLNKALDEIGMPNSTRERALLLGKMLEIPKQLAWTVLLGQTLPDTALLNLITTEFDIDASELLK